MKKNRMMRLASVLLVCVLLTTSVISGTFAKYTSEATGSDTARVAKWQIDYKANDGTAVNIVGNNSISFDLFTTVTDDDAANITAGSDDANVANGTGEKIIAPGTGGKFKMTVENKSEVTAKYTITLTAEQKNLVDAAKPIPIEYSLDNSTWATDITTLAGLTDVTLNMGASADVTVYWRWAFEDTTSTTRDTDDTALGHKAATDANAPSVTVSATITATQID